jgi:hypothetical protein
MTFTWVCPQSDKHSPHLESCFLKTYFNICPLSTLRSSKCCAPFWFPHWAPVSRSPLTHTCHKPPPPPPMALQLWKSLGLLDNSLPFRVVLYLFCPVHKLHLLQTISDIIMSFLIRLTLKGCLRITGLSFLCQEFLACQIFRDEVPGLVLNPHYLGGPRILCRGATSLHHSHSSRSHA